MGLKQDIVIVSEFSTPDGHGRGSRGGTPGSYVMRYMARKGACEDMAPVRREDNDAYVRRYMLRRDATERAGTADEVRDGIGRVDGLGGVAFGSMGAFHGADASMSDESVRRVSRRVQELFDAGHTVIKTVVSFDQEYLRRTGVIDADFNCEHEGDYRGNIDQMKLRLAVIHGMDRMSARFDDLVWVGCIQVDTMHVHCHLCMADAGTSKRMRPDGQQRGKLDATEMRYLRRGIDLALDEMQPVRSMAANIGRDRRNARCFVKKFTHELMASVSAQQLLTACLPDDRRLWRANTNRRDMRRANAICRRFVEEVLERPGSGYPEAMREIGAYADARRAREDLDDAQTRRLIDDGRERLIGDCMNGVYDMLRQHLPAKLPVRTPTLDVMTMDLSELAEAQSSDPLLEFGFKLRSYSSRLRHHVEERRRWHESVRAWESAERAGSVSEDSRPLYDFFRTEEAYNAMLVAKYRHFLAFLPDDGSYTDEFDEIVRYRRRMRNLHDMSRDRAFRRFKTAEAAEKYGRDVYGQAGGRWVVSSPEMLDRRLEAMADAYRDKVADFQMHLDEHGLAFTVKPDGTAAVERRSVYDFDRVKALDIHHMGYDFSYDAPISKVNVDSFARACDNREAALAAAVAYLEASGQAEAVSMLPTDDVAAMRECADALSGTSVLASRKLADNGGKRHRARAIRLTDDFEAEAVFAIEGVVRTVADQLE